MKNNYHYPVTFISILIAFLVWTCSSQKSVNPEEKNVVAALTFVAGGVWIERGSDRFNAKTGDRLLESDFLATEQGALVDVAVRGLGVMKVGSESRVQVAHLAVNGSSTIARMKLEKGDLVSVIKKESSESDYNVITPAAVAGVRGTLFLSSVAKDEKSQIFSRFAVMEGSILVKSESGEVILTPDTELTIEAQRKLTGEMIRPLSSKSLRKIKKLAVFHKTNVSEFRSLMDDARDQTAQIAALEYGGGAEESLEQRDMDAVKNGSDTTVQSAQEETVDQVIKRDTKGDPVKLKAEKSYQK